MRGHNRNVIHTSPKVTVTAKSGCKRCSGTGIYGYIRDANGAMQTHRCPCTRVRQNVQPSLEPVPCP